MDYYEYLQSPEWRELRRAVWRRCGGVCERCRQEPMQHTHHLTYERLFHERLTDLKGLCEFCHGALHGLGFDPMKPMTWAELEREIRRM